MNNLKLSAQFPGGCYIGFNAAIDRKSAEQFVMFASDMKNNGFNEINICLNSIGGILDQAYYTFNMIEAIDIKIITWNMGNIQSAANIIYLCGDKRYATPNSTFFFHQTGYDPPTVRITEDFLAERLKAAQYDDNRSAQIIASKTNKSIRDVRDWQNDEVVMNADAAVIHSISHEIRTLSIPNNAFFIQIQI